MTAVTKDLMSRARDIAGKVLYAQSRGEDIAVIIARGLSDEGRHAGVGDALRRLESFPALVIKALRESDRRGMSGMR